MALEKLGTKPNIVILLNDQQRFERHWPAEWATKNMPAMNRIKRHGLSFHNYITASCACSPSRGVILTGTYTAQTGVYHTLVVPGDGSNGDQPEGFEQAPLLPTQPNLARILRSVGYKVVWKGKWHLSQPLNGADWTSDDVDYIREAYGFEDWNPNDAGDTLDEYSTLGGGDLYDNDSRFVEGVRRSGDQDSVPGQSAIDFLRSVDPADQPFCLVVSIVNPHDIWVAPGFAPESGYAPGLGSEFGLPIPENANEDLATKPTAQEFFRASYNATTEKEFGPEKSPTLPANQSAYVNFYAHLQTLAEGHVAAVLDALDECGLTESTLIVRLADHGEMGMCHGLREKMYSAYEEAIHVPLIISNPLLFPEPQETEALASSVDIVPTLARIVGAYDAYEYAFRGVDLSPVLEDPDAQVQELVHFCYDDGYLTGDIPPYIRAIRTHDWKYAVYFNTPGSKFEYEMYDLKSDPNENTNLAGLDAYEQQLRELHTLLRQKMSSAGTIPPGIQLVTPEIEAEVEENGFSKRLQPRHWPTLEEAVYQSHAQLERERLDLEKHRDALDRRGFWMAVNRT